MRTRIIEVPHEVIPGTKVQKLVPEYPEYFEQEYQQSQREKADSKYPHGHRFEYYEDGRVTGVYVLLENGEGLWQLVNYDTYEPWTPPRYLGPLVGEADLPILTDGDPNMIPRPL